MAADLNRLERISDNWKKSAAFAGREALFSVCAQASLRQVVIATEKARDTVEWMAGEYPVRYTGG